MYYSCEVAWKRYVQTSFLVEKQEVQIRGECTNDDVTTDNDIIKLINIPIIILLFFYNDDEECK